MRDSAAQVELMIATAQSTIGHVTGLRVMVCGKSLEVTRYGAERDRLGSVIAGS